MKEILLLLSLFISHAALSQVNIASSLEEEKTALVLERVNGFSSSDRIEEILVNGSGNVWFAGKNGISTINTKSASLSHVLDVRNAVAVAVSAKGNVFSAFSNGKIYMNDRFLYHVDKEGIEINDLEIRSHKLWIGTNDGIYLVNTKTSKFLTQYTSENSKLKSNGVSFIHYYKPLDKLWIGTDKGIIEINKDDKWKHSNSKEKFIAVTENVDGMWLLSDKELWLVYQEYGKERWQQQGLRNGLYEGQVNDLALDADDNLYIASDILTRYNPYKDKLEKYGDNLGLVASKCLSLASDEDGVLWLGTADAGLFRIFKDKIELTEMQITEFLENPISCNGAMDGSIIVDVTGGEAPYTYLWERVRLKNNPNPKNLKAGTYKVTVVDANGIRKYASIKIDDPLPVQNKIVSTTPVSKAGKKDGVAVIEPQGGTPPYEILWANGEKGTKAKKLNYGYSYLTITDSNGCSVESNVTISKPKILPDLDIAKIKVGQTLQINNLYFAADSTDVSSNSTEVLEEVYDFMDLNKNVVIEVGGHTNNVPAAEYCDRLSTARAKSVAEYLYGKGIDQDRITYKGYGKNKPIASNDSVKGRKKNQRVEIKILRVEG
jgi:outer membrane protein OmpA-like peptidoglycan-associated protein